MAEAADQIMMQMTRGDVREALFSSQVRGMKCPRAGGARLLLLMGALAGYKGGRRHARHKCLVEVWGTHQMLGILGASARSRLAETLF